MRNINLLPVDYRPQPKFNFKSFLTILVSSLTITLIIFGIVYTQLSIRSINSLTDSVKENVTFLESRIRGLEGEKLRLENLESLVNTIETLERTKISYVELLNQVEEYTPEGMTITSLNISETGITLQAEAQELNLISTFIDALNGWEYSTTVAISQISSSNESFIFGIQIISGRVE